MHISEIGKKIGLEERKAGRILRLLATIHVFRESLPLHLGWHFRLMCILVSGKCFHKQSAEHPTPLDQPIDRYRASLVGLIYFEKSVFLMTQLSTDETVKATALLSEVLADKTWGHSYSPTQTAFNKSTGYPGPWPSSMYFQKVNTVHILFLQALTNLRMFPEELSSLQESELAWLDGVMQSRPRQLSTARDLRSKTRTC